ncbi:MAG: signal peptidase I [Deltaproteobacteria bacterium]|nr:signal peptidase I [Deltaproteobacteria bacterium]NND27256.1 signal peptidase I [Myxococcales bacterium]MBT8466311.1 signal peptidase I [Deltaproteobacteria bacterium]MBT8482602.1 signal peptidase I [Deltaproteobacteria bacterium]NNK08497.1 signal peptidase I [Myxococcales bacterium]
MDRGDGSFFGLIIQLAVIAFFIWVLWKIFEKAGKPGWAAIIPIYNVIVLLEIVGRPWWWIILGLIPVVNLVIGFLVALDLSRSFGHDLAFALGLFFLGFIFYPILAFGGGRYQGPAAAS